jgi:nitric oxide reductase large subunit
MSSSSWWYGIFLFPVVILSSLTSRFAEYAFFATAQSPDSIIGLDVAWFTLQMLLFWIGILVAVVVLVCLLGDLRLRSRDRTRSSSIFWGIVGVVHLGAVLFTELLFISVPALSYYLYRRRTDQ